MKRIATLVLGVLLTAQAWAQTTFTIGNLSYTVIEGTTNVSVAKGSTAPTGAIEIPPTVENDGTPYTVTSIGDFAFESCSGLTSVTIPNSVTSIGDNAFAYCSGLTSVTIPHSVTTIGKDAFYCCYNLTKADFASIKDLCKIKFAGLASNPLRYAKLFINGTLVTSVEIPNGVTSIGSYAFTNCKNITSITILDGVTSIDSYAFNYCINLTKITIANSVTTIGNYALNGCRGLTSVTIPNSVTSIGDNAFAYCSGLTSVSIGNSVTSIGGSAFKGCGGLTSVTIPSSVTSIGDNAFLDCSKLTDINVEDGNTDYSSEDGVLFNKDKTTIVLYPVGKTSTTYTIPVSVTNIGGFAFSSCSKLTSVTIPNSVTSIGSYAFHGCRKLTSIAIPNSVTSIGNSAFSSCSSLTAIAYDGTNEPVIGTGIFGNVSSSVTVCVPENYGSDSFGGLSVCKGLILDNATEPTCTETGLTEGWHCSKCGKEYKEVIPALGHNYGTPTYEWGEDNSTCTATKICANDNEHVISEIVDATSEITLAATCEAVGTRTFTAEFTGEGFEPQQKTEEIAATGHSYGTTVTAPTCTEVGYTTNCCSVCNDTYYSDTVAATGHTAGEDVAKNNVVPTCTAVGSVDSVVYCTVCESELSKKTVEIPATGHKEVVDAAVAATCTAAGKTEGKHCEVCNAVLVVQAEIPALGHDFKTYKFDNNATTEADGTETALCEHGCGTTDTRTAAGTKIATTPEKGTAVAKSAANAVSIYTRNNVIVVENATDEIRVYDAMGRMVTRRDAASLVSTTEIRVNTPGVYIVKTGNAVKRVMLND